jgi:hypothetical protein
VADSFCFILIFAAFVLIELNIVESDSFISSLGTISGSFFAY